MNKFFLKKKLSAYIHGELDDATSLKIKSLLERDDSFKREFENIKEGIELAEKLKVEGTPASVWQDISVNLGKRRKAKPYTMPFRAKPGIRTLTAYGGAFVVILALGWAYYVNFVAEKQGTIDLDAYITNLEESASPSFANTFGLFPENFEKVDFLSALELANIHDLNESSPFEDYQLTYQAVTQFKEAGACQLVYIGRGNVFTMFVATHAFRYDFGNRSTVPSQIEDLNFEKVDSDVNILYFNMGKYHCVLASTLEDEKEIETVLKFFRTAYWKTR